MSKNQMTLYHMYFFIVILSAVTSNSDHRYDLDSLMMESHNSTYVSILERFFWVQFYLMSVVNCVIGTEVNTGVLKTIPLPIVPNISHKPKL